MFIPAELIKKKKLGAQHSKEEIDFLINSYSNGDLPDYQMSAWLMAVYFQGMKENETSLLTQAMINSGSRVKFAQDVFPVDKHSTGGVGDKASLILGPIAAAAGVPVPMIAGRGLGHTGGTLDKLESIEGFNLNLSIEQFTKQVNEIQFSIMGQTKEICPADKKIYALRDVTGTVDSLPLICGSILSKKISEGINGLVLDIKVGTGAFMKTQEQAEELASALLSIGQSHGLQMAYFISDMNQPLGRFIGNGLEIIECIDILKGQKHIVDGNDLYDDTRQLSLQLAGAMIFIGKKLSSLEEGIDTATNILQSGQAYKKFIQVLEQQGAVLKDDGPSHITASKNKHVLSAPQDGYIQRYECEQIGVAGIQLKAGRINSSDSLDHGSGIELHKKIGDFVKKGSPLFTIYGDNPSLFDKTTDLLYNSVVWSQKKTTPMSLIYKRVVKKRP